MKQSGKIPPGYEPETPRIQGMCSTTELSFSINILIFCSWRRVTIPLSITYRVAKYVQFRWSQAAFSSTTSSWAIDNGRYMLAVSLNALLQFPAVAIPSDGYCG